VITVINHWAPFYGYY